MKYKDFLIYKQELINQDKYLDLSNLNLYSYFNIPDEVVDTQEPVHRCHALEAYLKLFNLPSNMKDLTGVTTGVRASLRVLFKELDNWIIPQDVYPFYQDTLSKDFVEYKTLIETKSLFNDIPNGTLLMCYPLKPYGRLYLDNEIESLHKFIKRHKDNTVVIDMAYWNFLGYPDEILRLYESGSVILLHSLSKILLLPDRLGVCVLPQKFKNLMQIFKELPKDNKRLLEATSRMAKAQTLIPEVTIRMLVSSQRLLEQGIWDIKFPYSIGYLQYSTKSHEQYLEEGIITVPESVFGGTGGGSILSSLTKLNA